MRPRGPYRLTRVITRVKVRGATPLELRVRRRIVTIRVRGGGPEIVT